MGGIEGMTYQSTAEIPEELKPIIKTIDASLKKGNKRYKGYEYHNSGNERKGLFIFHFNNTNPYRLYIHGIDILNGSYKRVMNGWV